MRNILSFLLLVGLLSAFLSCDHKKKATLLPELVRAEALMYDCPDSALMILEKMQVPSDRLQYATWCLLITQAKDKNYIKVKSDSLINIAYEYFKKGDDPRRKALAANYLGAVNERIDNIEKATEYYLEASREIEKTDDYKLACLIQTNLGLIYAYREIHQYALPPLLKAYQYAELSGDKIFISTTFAYIARAYAMLKDWDKVIMYYKAAINVANLANYSKGSSGNLSELAGVYRRMQKYDQALECARKSLNIKYREHFNVDQNLFILGDIYRLIGQSDSADYYLNKAMLTNNIYTLRSVYKALYFLYRDQGESAVAIGYNDKYVFYTDSIKEIDRFNKIIEIQEKYERDKSLTQKNRAEKEKEQTIHVGLFTLTLLLFVIAILVYFYQRKLIFKERTIQRNEELIRLYTLKIHENESLISRNEERLEILNSQIIEKEDVQEQLEEQQGILLDINLQNEELRQENVVLRANICSYSTTLQKKAEELDALKVLTEENERLHDRETFLCSQLLKRTDILNSLKTSPKYIDDSRWELIQEAVDWLYDSFSKRLSKQAPALTESDIQIACLIKLRLSNNEIATLIGVSSTSVSKRKQRIKERINMGLENPLDKKQSIDIWIWGF